MSAARLSSLRWRETDAVVAAAAFVFGVARPAIVIAALGAAALALMAAAWATAARRAGAERVPHPVAWSGAVVVLIAVGAARGDAAWHEVEPDELGPYRGWTTVMTDPTPEGRAWRVILEIDGERYELSEYGRAAGMRVSSWRVGERVHVAGTRRATAADRVRFLAPRHVVGVFAMDWASDRAPPSALHRVTNRVRDGVARAADRLDEPYGALYLGLVVGDDRHQPEEMVARFRASGLSHLTAVSGQNVAFVLAAAGPLLRALRPWWRWGVTCALIAWFVALTRFEPSILRAGLMAGLAATAFVLGRAQGPLRLVCLAVLGLVLVDPLLVWSVGFWLSVGATIGVSTVGPWLAARLRGWGPFGLPLGVTLGAQLGVAVPLLVVFGEVPLMSIPANVLAVPVAGAVMLYGLPAGLVAGNSPAIAGVVMAPVDVGVRWVDTVALVASRTEPSGAVAVAGWLALAALVAWTIRRAAPPAGPDDAATAVERPQ